MSATDGGEQGQDVPTSSEQENDSVRAALEAAFAESQSTPEDSAAEEAAAFDRARDEKGRFAAKQAQEAQAAEAKPTEKAEQAAQPAQQTQPQLSQFSPLQSWNAEQREAFAKLPPEAQAIVHQRALQVEQHFTRTAQQLSQAQQQYRDLEETIAPYEAKWALNGVPRSAVVKQLLQAQDFINTDPHGAIRWIAETTGVNLHDVVNGAPQVDPQIMTMQQQLEAMRSHIEQQQAMQQQQVLASASSEIQAFASETAADGSPLRPYLNQVSEDMRFHVELLRSQHPHASHRAILQEAYETACWRNPEIREALKQSELAAAETKRAAEERAKAQKAKAAGVSLTGAPNGTMNAPLSDDLRTLLAQQFEQYS